MERFFKTHEKSKVAYFSMEIGLEAGIPTYSGGLGILAGDTIKSAADLNVPMIAISLVHEKGYFRQELNEKGEQIELPVEWDMKKFLEPLDVEAIVKIEGRKVRIKAWRKIVTGAKGYTVPILFLDTDVEGNSDYDRTLTKYLYGGDNKYRFCQEIVLGIGGLRLLNALGYDSIRNFHMNEGHASLLTIELYRHLKDIEEVRKRCVFTTHTPVPSGHDKFDIPLIKELLPEFPFEIKEIFDEDDGKLNLTLVGLHFSHYINGVAKKHGEVSRKMFPGFSIDSITNGVHSATWISNAFKNLFDEKIPGWKNDPFSLRYAAGIHEREILETHGKAKKELIDFINQKFSESYSADVFTIGFARRSTAYKRPDLIFKDLEHLKSIAKNHGKIQFVFSGKAHARDYEGKEIIKRIFSIKKDLGENIKLVFIENYNFDIARMIVSGVDIWLNTPRRPLEASGTSGMKAAHNGVPSLSILDGWWLEGCTEGVTGWAIGDTSEIKPPEEQDEYDSKSLYDKLDNVIMPTYYNDKERWAKIMKHTIVINASFFNTHRMVNQYVLNAYFH